MKSIFKLFSVCFLFMFSFTIYNLNYSKLTRSEVTLYIKKDFDFDDLIYLLKKKEIIKTKFFFSAFSKFKNFNTPIHGKYIINSSHNMNELINILKIGLQTPVNLIFNNVNDIYEFSRKVSPQISSDSIQIINYFLSKDFKNKYKFNDESIKKIFIPNTYEVFWTISPERLFERMLVEYDNFWTDERKDKAKKINLSIHEVSVLASLVDKETSKNDEKPKIARLYLNRLEKKMKLQSDPTVVYSIKKKYGNQYKINRVLNKYLKIDSKFNTYLYKGLPPNPITIPSISSILSVLNPDENDYLYMCAKDDFSGYHNFTNNYNDHKINAKLFQNALDKKGVKK